MKLYKPRFSRPIDDGCYLEPILTGLHTHTGEQMFLVANRDHAVVDLRPRFADFDPLINWRSEFVLILHHFFLNGYSVPLYSIFFFHSCPRINATALALGQCIGNFHLTTFIIV